MRLVCIADLHIMARQSMPTNLPSGDVLVVAGDICRTGSLAEIDYFDGWIARQPHQYKVVIAGNHDWPFVKTENPNGLLKNGIYLQDSAVTINGTKFWGSPWQPKYFDGAFDLARGPELAAMWKKIPKDIDVLITHTPPFGVLDRTRRGRHIGCKDLSEAVQRIMPKAHIFGHVHESHGLIKINDTVFVNAAQRFKGGMMSGHYRVIELRQ